ncbi:MAG: helix-turn-helix transcriptional regulator [Planctomycetes bacterium]|jgi:transcriptional regulator with XRE-family HTH domain|nr:helix-turn-helix transcriptional regulator [Planctomycetota bacterium]
MNSSKDLTAAFADVLRQLRERAGLSQETLATKSGLDRTYISLLERGQRQPTLKTLARLAEALDTSLSALSKKVEDRLNENP